MSYGTLKVDNITYTNAGVDASTSVSGLVQGQFPNLTITGTISGATITGDSGNFTTITAVTGIFTSTLSGASVIGPTHTGTTANFSNGNYTGTLSGATVTGNAGQFTNLSVGAGNFTSITGTTITGATINANSANFTNTVTGVTFSGTTANFSSGVFTTQVSGSTVVGPTHTGTTANFSSGVFTSQISGATVTGGTGLFTTLTGGTIVGSTSISGKTITVSGSAVALIAPLVDAATITPDFASGCNFSVTLSGSRTLANPLNQTAGQSGSIFIIQDGSGSRTLSYGGDFDFAGGSAPTLSTTSGSVDRLDYIVRASGSIHAVLTKAYS